MKRLSALVRDERGATVVELAFALPVLIVMIYMIYQLGTMFRANAGIQHALGEGARYATLCLSRTSSGCVPPTEAQVKTKMEATVTGEKMGTYVATTPVKGKSGGATYYDLKVTYTQSTTLLLFPGPNISITKSKRVWVTG